MKIKGEKVIKAFNTVPSREKALIRHGCYYYLDGTAAALARSIINAIATTCAVLLSYLDSFITSDL